MVFCDGQIWRYDGACWVAFSERDIRAAVRKYDGAKFSDKGRVKLGKPKIDSILFELAVMLTEDDFFDCETTGMNVRNGLIQFNDAGEPTLTPHSQHHRKRHVIDQDYRPGAVTLQRRDGSLTGKLLKGCFLGDDDAAEKQNLIAEILGATALGYGTKIAAPKAIIFEGNSAENGKSQMLNLIRAPLPPSAISAIPLGKIGDERHSIGLAGKLLNASDELTSARAIASDNFKSHITGEPVVARDVYKSSVTFRPIAQHVYATNDLPSFTGGMDNGVLRRLLVVKFNRKIPKREKIENIGGRIAEEEPDVLLDLAVEGAGRFIRQRGFTVPRSSVAALREWRLGADPVSAWLELGIIIDTGPNAPWMTTREAFGRFRTWAVAEGYRENSLPALNTFTRRVKASDSGVTYRPANNGRYFIGICVSDAEVTLGGATASPLFPQKTAGFSGR